MRELIILNLVCLFASNVIELNYIFRDNERKLLFFLNKIALFSPFSAQRPQLMIFFWQNFDFKIRKNHRKLP